MNLELGMDVANWPPENVEELARRLDEPFNGCQRLELGLKEK